MVLEISSPAIEVPAPSLMQRAQSGAMDVTLLPNRTRGVNLLVVLDLGCFVNFSCLFDSKMTPNDFDTPKLDVVSPELNYAASQNRSRSCDSLETTRKESGALSPVACRTLMARVPAGSLL